MSTLGDSQSLRRSSARDESGYTYLVTTCVQGRDQKLLAPPVAEIVATSLQWLRRQERLLLHGYTIMPDHVHILMTVLPPFALTQVMHSLKSFTANRINRLLDAEGALWEDGYQDKGVRTRETMGAYLKYIAENPVRAGITSAPGEHRHTQVLGMSDVPLDPY